jgi:hypothetical protein
MSFLEKAARYRRVENAVVDAFIANAERQISALEQGKLTSRSWVRETGSGYVVRVGKLDGTYDIHDRGEVIEFLRDAINDARSDEEVRRMVEEAYAVPVNDAKPAKRKYNRKAKTEG